MPLKYDAFFKSHDFDINDSLNNRPIIILIAFAKIHETLGLELLRPYIIDFPFFFSCNFFPAYRSFHLKICIGLELLIV